MTLIEMMVALVLLSMLSIGLFASFRYGQRAYVQVSRVDDRVRDVLMAQRFLRGIIESAYPFVADSAPKRFGVEGEEDELHITANAPGYSRSGYYRYYIYARHRKDGLRDIVVRYGIDRHGNSDVDGLDSPQSAGVLEEVLLEGIDSLEFAYSEGSKRTPATLSSIATWNQSWEKNVKSPALVRARVTFPRGDLRRWPELIASPRITNGSTCEFDVVSQGCRGEQG